MIGTSVSCFVTLRLCENYTIIWRNVLYAAVQKPFFDEWQRLQTITTTYRMPESFSLKKAPSYLLLVVSRVMRRRQKMRHPCQSIEKAPPKRMELFKCWHYLSSRAVARQVLSARVSLTSVFGMGTGGPSQQSIPTHMDDVFRHRLLSKAVRLLTA